MTLRTPSIWVDQSRDLEGTCMLTMANFQCSHFSLLSKMISEHLLIHPHLISWTLACSHIPWGCRCFLVERTLLRSAWLNTFHSHLPFSEPKWNAWQRKEKLLSEGKMERERPVELYEEQEKSVSSELGISVGSGEEGNLGVKPGNQTRVEGKKL